MGPRMFHHVVVYGGPYGTLFKRKYNLHLHLHVIALFRRQHENGNAIIQFSFSHTRKLSMRCIYLVHS